MEHEPIYEILLKTQCYSYNQVLYLLERISRCDDGLLIEASKDNPSVQKISDFTSHKNDLISEIDRITLSIQQNQIKLNGVMSLVVNASSHPLLERLQLLQELVTKKIDYVILEEDRENTYLCDSLTKYKERLELDKAISEVPMEKRKIFFYNPNE